MQSAQPQFGRMIPAMVTPFDDELQVDFNKACALAERLVAGGSDAILLSGTTGESPTVSTEDKLELFRRVVDHLDGSAPVIANIGSYNTAASIELAKHAEDCGVQGLMAVVPYYNKPPQSGMFAHFSAIAEAVDLPIILYNIPGRTGVNMLPETTLSLARAHKNIVAVKEASGNLEQIERIIIEAPEGFVVYSGDDALTYDVMKLGGVGVITTIGNVTPGRMKEIVELCAKGAFDEAYEAHTALLPLMKGLFATANPILVKEALRLTGFPVGGLRLPLVPATKEESDTLASVLRAVGELS